MRKTSKKLSFQNLENRELMAADLANGELRIETPDSNDNIEVSVETSYQYATLQTSKSSYLNVRYGPTYSVPLIRTEVVYRNHSDGGSLMEEARFDVDDVSRLRIYANGGHDEVTNNTGIRAYIYGGTGNDTLIGGQGVDYLYGQSGNDLLKGQAGNDRLYGQSGDDVMEGQAGDDYLFGSTGDDILRGGSGSDRLYGNSGRDNLYGQSGEDRLYGGNGDDGLFGGAQDDYLSGSTGDDRFLVVKDQPVMWWMESSDTISDLNANDARINFVNGEQTTFHFSGDNSAEFAAGEFTDLEIEKIDEALADLHHRTGNTNLLKTSNLVNNELTFERLGAQIDGDFNAAGVNSAGKIILVDPSFDADGNGVYDTQEDDDWLKQVVFHEIGHNFDNENSRWNEWKEISGWRSSFFWWWEDSSDYSTSGDEEWAHLEDSEFARNYGKFNPYEDFATYFAKRMMDDTGRSFADGDTGETSNEKEAFLDAFFAEMA